MRPGPLNWIAPIKGLLPWKLTLAIVGIIAMVGAFISYQTKQYVIDKAETDVQNMLLQHKGLHLYVQRNSHRELDKLKVEGEIPDDLYSPTLFSSSYMVRNMHQYYNEEREKDGKPSLYYKMAANNPRNPINKADELEKNLIHMFNENRDVDEFRDIIEVDGQEYLYVAIPFLTNEQRCMACHGDRENAPIDLQELYPGTGGFNEKVGEIRAIESIRAPLKGTMTAVNAVLASTGLVGLGILILVVLNSRLRSAVIARTSKISLQASQLRESEERYRDLIEGTDNLVVRVNPEGIYTYANHAAERFLGTRSEQCIGRSAFDFICDDNRESTKKWFAECAQKKLTTGSFENRTMNTLGDIRDLHWTCDFQYDDNGQLLGVNSIARDITERKQVEQALRESEEQVRHLLNSTAEGIYGIDLQGNCTFCNPACLQMLGYDSSDQLLGKNIHRLIHHSRIDSTHYPENECQIYSSCAHAEEVHIDDELFWRPDGTSLPVEYRSHPVLSDGHVTGAVVTFLDITERKATEKHLKMMQCAVEQAGDEVYWIHPDGRIAYANETACQKLGYSRDEMLQLGVPDVDTVFKQEKWDDFWAETKNLPKKLFETTHKTKDGEEYPVEVRANRVEFGDEMFLFASARDITERKGAEEQLRQLQNYLSNIIDSMPSVLIGVDAQGDVTQWNREAELVTGVGPGEAMSKRLDLVYPQLADEMQRIREAVKDRKVLSQVRSRAGDQNGSHYEDVTIYPLVTNGVEGAVIRIDDVTDSHLLQEQLHQSRKMDAIGQLAGGVAHDFNNMLAGILGMSELIETKLPPDFKDLHNYLAMIIESAERAADLTDKLLTFSRKGKVESTAVDVHQAVESAVGLLQRSLDKKVKVALRLDAEKSTVIGDLTQLQNAFLNLGINAGHAMTDGGELTFRSSVIQLDEAYCRSSSFDLKPGDYLDVEVHDNGCGIAPEDISKIFDPFFTTRKQGEGTGLGLAAVFGSVKQHSGAITVCSESGHGTVFHVFIPLTDQSARPKDTGDDIRITGSGRILVIDDEPVIRATANALLKDLGYEVLLAENGQDGLDVYRREHASIDLVLLDMIMPEMGGRECFVELRKIDPNACIILASGFSQAEDTQSLYSSGLCGFIRKPYRSSDLSQMIDEAMHK